MAQSVLKRFASSAKQLDDLIFKLETNLGKQHTVSPFTVLYQRHGFSTENTVNQSQAPSAQAESKPVQEEVKVAAPKEQKQQKPKQEGNKEQQPKKQP